MALVNFAGHRRRSVKLAKREKIKKSLWVIHLIAHCKDCDWKNENYKNGQALAAIHAKKNRHLVHYEIGFVGEYDGRAKA